jgi:hypothetical protein
MRRRDFFVSTFLAISSVVGVARAQMPGHHPYYMHALSDLRGARWLLEHRQGDMAVRRHEDIAIQEIDAAIAEIRRAAINDGRGLHDHPPMDGGGEYGGRLHRALDVLRRVHSDVAREEDDPMTRGLRNRAVRHIDEAAHQVEEAIRDMERHR